MLAGFMVYPFLSLELNIIFKFFIGAIIYAVIYICLLLIFRIVDFDMLGRYLSQIKSIVFDKMK